MLRKGGQQNQPAVGLPKHSRAQPVRGQLLNEHYETCNAHSVPGNFART